jgi:hypothetical protein
MDAWKLGEPWSFGSSMALSEKFKYSYYVV